MTPEQLEAIKARNAARTPGKWLGMDMVNMDGSPMSAEYIGEYVKNSVKKTAEEQKVERFLFVTKDGDNQPDICHVGNGPMGPHNVEFIAHASEDIPSLIAALEAEREKVREADNDVLLLIGMIYGKSPNKEMTAVTEQIVGRLRARATLTEGK
ncbi:MAG: hypothetical protein ABL936_19110 [Aestuariivirga sp.]